MTMHIRDTHFSASHASADAIPLDRIILCTLHCPMRAHEKVLTMMLQEACQNRMPCKSVLILDEMAILDEKVTTVRRLASLKEIWTYVWEKGAEYCLK
jgi:hypothetical protein